MAQQEEGWPLGLQPLNVRVGLVRNRDFFGSASFHTLLSGSPTSSTDSSSDLDTESTGSFFHDKSITLGSLMGVSSIVHLSRRSARVRRPETSGSKKICKSNIWCFSLCPRDRTDANLSVTNNNNNIAPSLGHFLAVERRAADEHRRSHSPLICGPDELALVQFNGEPNSLFVDVFVAPPRSSPWGGSDVKGRENRGLEMGVEFLYSSHACVDTPFTNIDGHLEEVPFCETIFDESPLLLKDSCFILCLLHKLPLHSSLADYNRTRHSAQ